VPPVPKVKSTVPIKGLVNTGHAEVVRDKKSGGVKWLTFGAGEDIGIPLAINEPISFPPTMFKIGTRIDILENVNG